MTATGTVQDHRTSTLGRRRELIVDVAAPAFVVLYVVLAFKPFELLVAFPGLATSVVLPALGVGILAVTPTERLARVPVSLPLLGSLVWTALSVLWSDVPSDTLYTLRSEQLPLAVLLLVVGTIPPRVAVRTLLVVAVAVTAWSLLVSLVLPMAREVEAEVGIEAQAGFRGTFGHKNILGVFAVLSLAIVLPMLRGRGRLVVLGVLVLAALTTRSATTGGGLMALVFVWLWMVAIERGHSQRDRRLLLFVSISSAVVGLLLVLRLAPVLLELYDKDVTFSGRTTIWAESMKVVGDRPWLGHGLAGVWTDPPTALTVELWRHIRFPAAHAHNGVVALLMEVGVVGVALMTVFVVSVIRLASRVMHLPALRRYGQWGLLITVSLLVMSLAEPLFVNQYLGYLGIVWSVLASLANEARAAADRPVVPRRPTTTF